MNSSLKSVIASGFTVAVGILSATQAISAPAKGKYEIKLEQFEEQKTVVMKAKATFENVGSTIESILNKVGEQLAKQGVEPVGAPFTRTFMIDETSMEFECGFPVQNGIQETADIVNSNLPQTTAATTLHTGSPETSQEGYDALHIWMQSQRYKEAGAP